MKCASPTPPFPNFLPRPLTQVPYPAHHLEQEARDGSPAMPSEVPVVPFSSCPQSFPASVLPWAGGPDPSPPRWGLTSWLSAPPTLAADVFGRSPLCSVEECVAVQLRARWPLTVHTWKEPEREALGRARALPLRGSRGQKAGARSSGAGPSPACPPLAARVLKGMGRGHLHRVMNKPAIN